MVRGEARACRRDGLETSDGSTVGELTLQRALVLLTPWTAVILSWREAAQPSWVMSRVTSHQQPLTFPTFTSLLQPSSTRRPQSEQERD